jgi:hypothetical protein
LEAATLAYERQTPRFFKGPSPNDTHFVEGAELFGV